MAAFKVWTFVLLAGTACSASPSRIIGGAQTTIERHPSIVQVDYFTLADTWVQSCAANVLTSRHVLSAAHCFRGWDFLRQWRRIRAGSTFRNVGGTIHYVQQEYIHPSYYSITLEGDIGVVLLETPLIYSPTVQQGAIISQGFIIPDNTSVVHAGWGFIDEAGPPSGVLQNVSVFTVNHTVCTERYSQSPNPRNVSDNMICSGILDVGGKGVCQADSGGPMYFGNVIVGIVSFSRGCAQAFFPAVSTRVASYTNWIVDIVAASQIISK